MCALVLGDARAHGADEPGERYHLSGGGGGGGDSLLVTLAFWVRRALTGLRRRTCPQVGNT